MSFTLATSLMASNYAGHTKKTTATAIIYVGWAAGLIAGPRKFSQFLLGIKTHKLQNFSSLVRLQTTRWRLKCSVRQPCLSRVLF